MSLSLTNELLAKALAELANAERALEADPTNKWLKMSVEVEKNKVESIRQSLSKDKLH